MVFYVLGGLGPTIAPFAIIGCFDGGEMKAYLSRIFKWRIYISWYLLSVATVVIMSAALMFMDTAINILHHPWYMLFPMFLTMILGGGLEELGWRGFLLEQLLAMKWPLLSCGLLVGAIWGLWHLPLFYIKGVPQYGTNYALFFVKVIGFGLILTTLYAATRSIFLCVMFHAMQNTSWTYGFVPNKTDIRGGIIESLVWLIVGAIFIFVYTVYTHRGKQNGG